jgi:hypothetical protein
MSRCNEHNSPAGLLMGHDRREDELTQPIITIPAELLEGLREGAYRELCCVADSFTEAVQTYPGHPDADLYQGFRERAMATCGLLDRAGWSRREPVVAFSVDVPQEGAIVVASLRFAREAFIEELGRAVEGNDAGEVPAIAMQIILCTERLSVLESIVSGARDDMTSSYG